MRINRVFALAALASAILGHASAQHVIVEQPVSVAKCQRAEGCPMGEEYRHLQEQQHREDQKKSEDQAERQGKTGLQAGRD